MIGSGYAEKVLTQDRTTFPRWCVSNDGHLGHVPGQNLAGAAIAGAQDKLVDACHRPARLPGVRARGDVAAPGIGDAHAGVTPATASEAADVARNIILLRVVCLTSRRRRAASGCQSRCWTCARLHSRGFRQRPQLHGRRVQSRNMSSYCPREFRLSVDVSGDGTRSGCHEAFPPAGTCTTVAVPRASASREKGARPRVRGEAAGGRKGKPAGADGWTPPACDPTLARAPNPSAP